MTLSTIQPIGKNPTTTPSSDARTDMPAGMVKTKMVTMLATMPVTRLRSAGGSFSETGDVGWFFVRDEIYQLR